MWWRRRGLAFVNVRMPVGRGDARSVRIVGDRIADVDGQPHPRDVVVDGLGSTLLPGLVNAHDHLARNHFRRLKWRDRYQNVSEWIADFQPRFGRDPDLTEPMAVAEPEALWFGALKNLLSGVTTVCHHDPIGRREARRLPVRLAGPFGYSHSLEADGAEAVVASRQRTPAGRPWIVHAAEGVDREAAAEFEALERLDCIRPGTVIVHGVGLDAAARRRLAGAGGSLIWCPSSNQFLFGSTLDPADLARRECVALGTDSRLSGSRDILEELQLARELTSLSDAELARLVLDQAGRVLGLPDAGRLDVGRPADLTLWKPGTGQPAAACIVGASRCDLWLVMIAGRPLVAAPPLRLVFDISEQPAMPMRVDGEPRLFSAHLADRIARLPVAEPGLVAHVGGAA